MVLVGGNMSVNEISREHIFLCLSLGIPLGIIVTKIDICKTRGDILAETVDEIKKILKAPGIRKVLCKIESEDDVITCVRNKDVVPIFYTSNLTLEGMDYLKLYFNLIGKRPPPATEQPTESVEFYVESKFNVVGHNLILGGQLISGTVKTGDKLLLGPTSTGEYTNVTVRSIHCKRVNVLEVKHGSYVCFAIPKIKRADVRRGMVLIDPNSPQLAVWRFSAKIQILKTHSTTIRVGYMPVIHTHSIRQSAKIISISKKTDMRNTGDESEEQILRTGDRALVDFRFEKPEYIKPGYRLLLSEGRVKIIGIIEKIYPE
jgi:GTPase